MPGSFSHVAVSFSQLLIATLTCGLGLGELQ